MYGLPRGLRAMMCAGDVSDVDRGGLEGAQTGVREAWLIGQFRVFEAVSPSCSGLYRSQACAERAYAMRTTGWCKKMDLNLPFPTVGTHRGLPCRNSPMWFPDVFWSYSFILILLTASLYMLIHS